MANRRTPSDCRDGRGTLESRLEHVLGHARIGWDAFGRLWDGLILPRFLPKWLWDTQKYAGKHCESAGTRRDRLGHLGTRWETMEHFGTH